MYAGVVEEGIRVTWKELWTVQESMVVTEVVIALLNICKDDQPRYVGICLVGWPLFATCDFFCPLMQKEINVCVFKRQGLKDSNIKVSLYIYTYKVFTATVTPDFLS